MTVIAVLDTVACFKFGAAVDYGTHWSVPVLTFGLANMGLAFASTCVFGYAIDLYLNLREEVFVASMRGICSHSAAHTLSIAGQWRMALWSCSASLVHCS